MKRQIVLTYHGKQRALMACKNERYSTATWTVKEGGSGVVIHSRASEGNLAQGYAAAHKSMDT